MPLLSTGASRVFIFDHTIRRVKKPGEPDAARRGPVRNVHIDQSYNASVERVRYHLPEEAEKLLQKRFQIINVCKQSSYSLSDPAEVQVFSGYLSLSPTAAVSYPLFTISLAMTGNLHGL